MFPEFLRPVHPPIAVSLSLLLAFALGTLEAAAAVSVFRLPPGAMQPSVSVDGSGTVHLVWLQGDPKACDVYYTALPGGRIDRFAPIRVNSQAGSAIAIGTIRGAQVAAGRNGHVHIAWNGSSAAPRTTPTGPTPLLYSRRASSTSSFDPEKNLIGNTLHLDGGASVAAGRNGTVSLVWHALPGGAVADESHRQVFAIRSIDDGTSFGPIETISPQDGVCACCALKALEDRSGRLLVLYRSLSSPDGRPMTLLASTGKRAGFARQTIDPWPTSTCPMSSASLIEGSQGVWTGWETGGQVRASLAPSPALNPASEAVNARPPATLSDGMRNRHPSLAVNALGQGLCVWAVDTGWQKGGSVAWRSLSAAGLPSGPITRQTGLAVWSFPAAFPQENGDFVVTY